MYNSESGQDKFVLNVLQYKKNGFFLEIGSNHPIQVNNTYILENEYNWNGIMVEYEPSFLPLYQQHRPNSIHVIQDATLVDYKTLFETNNVPLHVDYLQIDLEVGNGSTLTTLQKLDEELFDTYKFSTITFEHDIYYTNHNDTREESRKIFYKRGYVCVFSDINNGGNPYEDWYVHPELVNMDYILELQKLNKDKYCANNTNPIQIVIDSIRYQDIIYPDNSVCDVPF